MTPELLKKRSAFLQDVRSFFLERDYSEVQTPVLSTDTMIDRQIEPISCQLEGYATSFFLQTSPEFSMKRLLMDGSPSIFQIGPAFRNGESGARHNPEFTMLEYYSLGHEYTDGMNFLRQFSDRFFPDRACQLASYQSLFDSAYKINPHLSSAAELLTLCNTLQIDVPSAFYEDRDALLQLLMNEGIEPNLGTGRPVIVYDWPASQAALAKTRLDTWQSDSNPNGESTTVAERFEWYVDGVELANGYHELTDYEEHLRRLNENNRLRELDGKRSLPVESRFLESLRSSPLPNCCGVAVGLDRLFMLTAGLSAIQDAMAFSIGKA